MDCSPPGSSVYGIFQARVLEWVTSADRYTDDTTLMAESEEEPKSLLMKVKSESEVAQLCLTLRDPMDCSLPGFSVHGICQARVLEWGAVAFSGHPA